MKRLDAEHYEEHRQRRLQHKSVYLRLLCRLTHHIHVGLNPSLCYSRSYPLYQSPKTEVPCSASGRREWAHSYCNLLLCSLQTFFWKPQRTAPRSLLPDDPRSRCLTSICRRTKFYSYRICPRVLAKTNLWRSSHSEYPFALNVTSHADVRAGTPTCTRFVSSQTKRTLRSSST